LKKITLIITIFISTLSVLFTANSFITPEVSSKQIIQQGYKSADNSNAKMYHDALSALLSPHVDKAIDGWYSKNPQYIGGTVDPWDIKIISIERIPYKTLWFNIKVEVMPYTLAHISTGKDRITFELLPTGDATVIKFEHLESYPLPKRN
jgi:hypothetical protein